MVLLTSCQSTDKPIVHPHSGAIVLMCSLVQGAVVFVCGSASKMPQDVLEALQQVLRQEAGMTMQDASKYFKQLELTGRYITEAWS